MKTRFFVPFGLAILFALTLSACTAENPGSAQIVETYLTALVNKDQDRLLASVCPAWEEDALMELDAFSLVKTSLDGLSCSLTSQEDRLASVTCQGSLIATYGNENQTFDLSQRTFQVELSGSDWLVCGYE